MELVSETQKAAGKHARYVEEFQEFFATHKLHCGAPADLLELASKMETSGTFRDELSSMVRSVIFREGGNVPRTELLKLVTISIGGPQIDDEAGRLQQPIGNLMSYLTAIVRAPKNQPAPRNPDPADLHPADLHPADLHPADLHPADLHPADLHPADLHPANTDLANVRPANVDAAAPEPRDTRSAAGAREEEAPITLAPPARSKPQPPLHLSEREASDAAALLEELRLVELKNLEVKSQLGSLYERISRMEPRAEKNASASSELGVESTPEPRSDPRRTFPLVPASPSNATPSALPITPPPHAPAAPASYPAEQLPMAALGSLASEAQPGSLTSSPTDNEDFAADDEVLRNDPWNENSDLQKVLRRFAEQKAAQEEDAPPERSGLLARIGSSGYVKWFAGSAVVLMLMLFGIALRHRTDTPPLVDPVSPTAASGERSLPKPNPYDGGEPVGTERSSTSQTLAPAAAAPTIAAPTRSVPGTPAITPVPPKSNPTSQLPTDSATNDRPATAQEIAGAGSQQTPEPIAQDPPGKARTNLLGKNPYGTKSSQPLGLNVSSGVMAGNLISAPAPQYPRLASLTHIQGQVLLQAIVSKSGAVEHLKVIRGHRLLRGAAMDAVHKWRYRPYVVNGRPVDVATIIRVDFQLHR